MKKLSPFMFIFLTIGVYAQDLSVLDFKELFRKAKKTNTEVTIFHHAPNGFRSDSEYYLLKSQLTSAKGVVLDVMNTGVLLSKEFSKPVTKQKEDKIYKTEVYYVPYHQIVKVKFVIAPNQSNPYKKEGIFKPNGQNPNTLINKP